MVDAAEQPSVLIDQVEPAVAENTVVRHVDLRREMQPEPFHGRDLEARDGDHRRVGSKRCLASVRSSGTAVGYLRVRQARQNVASGRRVAAWSPSSDR